MEHKSGIFIQIGPETTKLLLFEIGNFEGWQVWGTIALNITHKLFHVDNMLKMQLPDKQT